MNPYWIAHATVQKITDTVKSLKICYFVYILRPYVDYGN